MEAIAISVLQPMGFRCFTVGRNITLPEQADDATRELLNSCECLIGVATERFTATDRDYPDSTLKLATPYLLQETSMAYQSNLPFLLIKARNVTLQAITGRNLCLEIDNTLSSKGKVRFYSKPDAVKNCLQTLKRKALERRANLAAQYQVDAVKTLTTYGVLGFGLFKSVQWLLRPDCFGNFYYKDAQCKNCKHREECKIKKAQNKP